MVLPINGNNYSRCFVGKNTPVKNSNCTAPSFKNTMIEVKEQQRPMMKYGIPQPPNIQYFEPPLVEIKYGINLPTKPIKPENPKPLPDIQPKYAVNIPDTLENVIDDEHLIQTKYGINQ